MFFKNRLKRFFVEDQSGVILVELIVMLPAMLFAFYMGFAFFDAYQAKVASERAAYTLGDLISRETGTVDSAYIDGMGEIFTYLTDADQDDYWFRVTSLTWSDEDEGHTIDWSDATTNNSAMTQSELNSILESIPLMADGDTIMVVETNETYTPILSNMIGNQIFKNINIVRARFVPAVLYEDS
ncbi:MAG: hypothetical protein P8Q99_11390 [Paracoccaceae bacterium]|nr:hypothetical protein [Paracoccaceae bacterium]